VHFARENDETENSTIDKNSSPAVLRSMTFKSLDTKAVEVELMSEFLMEIGAASTSITDHDRGTELERPVFREPGVTSCLWGRCDLTAHFPSSFDLNEVAESVRETFDLETMWIYGVEDLPDRDWVMHVQSSWKPIIVSRFLLRFPWHTSQDVRDALRGQNRDVIDLQLEGGIAFGTGEHPTTQLCLQWLQDTITRHSPTITRFLDYGSGSGILGLAACALSKNITAVGVEIDLDAIQIADYNAEINNLPMKSYLPPLLGTDVASTSIIAKSQLRARSDLVLPQRHIGPFYDACAANILALSLITLADTIAGMLRSGGFLGLSGILHHQSQDVIQAYSSYFDHVHVQNQSGEWVLVTGIRK